MGAALRAKPPGRVSLTLEKKIAGPLAAQERCGRVGHVCEKARLILERIGG